MGDFEPQKKEDFALSGKETFKVAGQEKGDGRVVLNIQDDKPGIILDKDKKTKRKAKTGNFIVDLYERSNDYLVEHSKVKVKAKATFYHLLSVMLNAGIPMVTSLRSLFEQTDESPKLKRVIGGVATAVEDGGSLSEAMLTYPDVFADREIGMIQSGEESGRLTKVLQNLAHNTEKAYAIQSKVKAALMYPAAIFMLLIVVIIAMMVFVVPKMTDLFAANDQELPLITRIVLGLSDFMIGNGILLSFIVLLLILLSIVFKKTDTGKYLFDKMKLKMPVFGKLFKKLYLSRFAMSLSDLMDSGISIVKAFEITADSIGNEVYRRRIMLAREDMKQGIKLADNLNDPDLFPPMLVSMIEVGEKTAQLGEITGKIADFYESEVDDSVQGLSKILEPVILVVVGITVGGVVAAIMLPIMQLSDFAGSF